MNVFCRDHGARVDISHYHVVQFTGYLWEFRLQFQELLFELVEDAESISVKSL